MLALMPCPSGEGRRVGEGTSVSLWASVYLSVVVPPGGRRPLWPAIAFCAGLTRSPAGTYFQLSAFPERFMPRCAVTRRAHFNAAHRLHNAEQSPEWNREMFGVCNNPNYHGHNYELDVTVEGDVNGDSGYVIDLARLADLVEERAVRPLDHQNLNLDVPWFQSLNPTAENIAIVIWRQLREAIPAHFALAVRLWETPRNYVDYRGD